MILLNGLEFVIGSNIALNFSSNCSALIVQS